MQLRRVGENVLKFWRSSRATQAATAAIAPYVRRSRERLGGIPDSVWRDPYLLGFVSMLITLVGAEHSRGRLTGDEMGIVQINAWVEITGIPDDLVGEDICRLSASGDEIFQWGCRDAASFYEHLQRCRHGYPMGTSGSVTAAGIGSGHPGSSIAEPCDQGDEHEVTETMWRRFFEDRVASIELGGC